MLAVAVLAGLQASGKTTFCQRMLDPGVVVVSRAHFRHARHRQRRQVHLVEEALSAGRDAVADNTNPSQPAAECVAGAVAVVPVAVPVMRDPGGGGLVVALAELGQQLRVRDRLASGPGLGGRMMGSRRISITSPTQDCRLPASR